MAMAYQFRSQLDVEFLSLVGDLNNVWPAVFIINSMGGKKDLNNVINNNSKPPVSLTKTF